MRHKTCCVIDVIETLFARATRKLPYLGAAFTAPLVLVGTALADTPGQIASDHGASDQGEIIVTATRREQPLADVAASDSAFTGAQMDALGVKSVAELSRYTAGVTYDYLTHNVAIRGVGSTAGAGTTGIYIDDTPIQMRALDFNPNNALPNVFNLGGVKVLPGPKGTLFGEGAEGGAIRYITNQPSLSEFSGLARLETAFTKDGAPSYEAGAAIGGPIRSGALGFRVSGWFRRDGGWIDQVDSATGALLNGNANSMQTEVWRAALTWAPTSRLVFTPSLNFQNRDQRFYDQYWIGLSNPRDGDFRNGDPGEMGDHDKFVLPTLTIRYEFDNLRLTAVASYYERHERVNGYNGTLYDLSYFQQLIDPSQPGGPIDPAGAPCPACRSDLFPLLQPAGMNLPGALPFQVNSQIFNAQFYYTQEVRLESSDPDAPITWLVGAFHAEQKGHSTDRAVDPDLVNIVPFLFGESVTDIWGMGLLPGDVEYVNDTVSHDRQLALFADATLNLTPRLKLDAGVRYAWTQFSFVNSADGPLNFGASGGSGSEREHPLTPRLGLSYQADADNLFYVSAARGYRVGGANAPFPESICQADLDAMQISSTPASYQSDTVTSYEAGARNRLFNRKLTTAFSVFHANWDRIQQSNYLPSCGFQYTANLGAAVSDGFDFDANFMVTSAWTINLSLGYTDARYSQTTRTGAAPSAPILSRKGDSLGAPRWTLAFGAQYDFALANEPAFIRVDYSYASTDPRLIPARDPQTTSFDPFLPHPPETHYLSVRAGTALGLGEINVFADNLLNAHPRLNLNHQDQFTELLEATTFRPLTIGVSITRRY